MPKSSRQRGAKRKRNNWAQPSFQPFLDLPSRHERGWRDGDAHTREEDKPGAAAPGSPGHGVSRCWYWVSGGTGERGRSLPFLASSSRPFLGWSSQRAGAGEMEVSGWFMKNPFWFVVYEGSRIQGGQRRLCLLQIFWNKV